MAAQQCRENRESRTLQLHVALRSEVNAKFRHFGTCSQPTCFIKKLFINSCGPRSVSKMFEVMLKDEIRGSDLVLWF